MTACITICSMSAVRCAKTTYGSLQKETTFTELHYVPAIPLNNKIKKKKEEKKRENEDKDFNHTCLKSDFGNVTVLLFWSEIQPCLLMSYSHSDGQMSHCFLFVISQVENDRAQAPERSNTEGVFHGVHLKCCWLDALSTAKGLFVS